MQNYSLEYDKVYDIATKSLENDDAYKQLIMKEGRIIGMINRVVNQKNEEKMKKDILNTPINVVVYRVFKTMNDVINDLKNKRNLKQIFREERRLYLGLFISFFSFLMIFFIKSDGN
jgi:hypothetical protein